MSGPNAGVVGRTTTTTVVRAVEAVLGAILVIWGAWLGETAGAVGRPLSG